LLNRTSPQFDQAQSAQAVWRIPTVHSYAAIDDMTVEIRTDGPDALLLYSLSWILISSPKRWEQAHHDWAEVARSPAGTGPWILDSITPRQQATLRRNPDYWDNTRIPLTDRLILRPVPDPNTRTSALLSGAVDYIESPAPDTLPALRAAGMNVVTGPMPHSWPYTLSRVEGSPFNDIRVRKAINLAIDRDGLVMLLGGLARPARGVVQPESPWFGKPRFNVHYDPVEARRLLAEAGYGPQHPLRLRFMIAPSGSGQMVPLPMNEFVQQNLADVGVELSFEVLEWQVLRSRRDAGGAAGPSNKGIDALNNSWNSMDPLSAILRHVDSRLTPPAGLNWGFINDPVFDTLIDQVKVEFDPVKQDALLARIHERMVDQAVWIFVVHDVNPRVLSPHVKGFIEAQSWFVDFSPIHIE
jgi:ABC-type transport system substrate-binding protein